MRLADGCFRFSVLLLVLGARGLGAVGSVGEGTDLPDAAVNLNVSDFETVLRGSPASFAVVEFFAHWCPACRNYKPHYEKVARMFNGPNAVHPGIVLMARVDCAMKINTNLCGRFSVGFYPMLLWGPPAKFVSGRWTPKQENTELQLIDDGRTADQLLNWINKKLGSSFNFVDGRYENENTFSKNASYPEQIARAIYDVEEATALAIEIVIENKMIKSSTQAPIIKFLQLLVAHHPSKRCRRGIADLLISFDDMWPSGSLSEETHMLQEHDILKSYPICGKEVPRRYWIFCRGSKDHSRGFSCGLWVLFHSLSVRVADGESQLVFTAIRDFIQNFFVCDDCRRHFSEMASRVSAPFNTTRDLSIWLWKAHNEVNERLVIDPRFPKIIWPPNQLCPSCYTSSSVKNSSNKQIIWNEDEVYKFLVHYYGRMLVSSYKDTTLSQNKDGDESNDTAASSNAVAVPIGAALAIALASCTFGALACFWRAKQKKKKYLHQLRSFKEV
ncbi:sulfhydryl oxidase 1-like [Zingiber officinale]|uniref:sulfhydryl oxidase 1-like n=1 Tax=Zingiber officinale TaxID=94328 RepID=UPI001C4AF3D4|nr:sulfhydryl oxidase 1-like [Zingiber officinale]